MPRTCGGAAPRQGPPRKIEPDDSQTDQLSRASITRPVTVLADWRERSAWIAAAAHLNAHGLPAVVPPGVAGYLSRLGLAVWPSGSREAR
jgi:hypothetical protein